MALNLKAIKAVVADIDGVFSDVLIPLADGDLLRSMDAKDCFAFRHCRRRGLITGIISGGDTPALRKRCLNLGVEPENLFLGARGKRRILEQYCAQNGLSLEEVCFIGDDIPDVPAIKAAGLGVAPADAVPEAIEAADFVSSRPGGHGCIRETIELILRDRGLWHFEEDEFEQLY